MCGRLACSNHERLTILPTRHPGRRLHDPGVGHPVADRLARRTIAPRAAQDLGDQAMELGNFRFQERSGRTVTQADLADRVWVGSFIFTRCPLSCPRISSVMKGLQEKLGGHPRSCSSACRSIPTMTRRPCSPTTRGRFGADADRWWFLTGDRASIYELIRDKFKLTVMENPAADPEGQGESISHSDRLALVDRGRVVGLFDSNDPAAIDSLVAQARGGRRRRGSGCFRR